MKVGKRIFYLIIFFSSWCLKPLTSFAHDIYFCGEKIPVNDNFVATRLMDVIRRQIPQVNMPQLRKRVVSHFPRVEYYLQQKGLPEDLKYLAIVESGFLNVTSPAGARGFWQLMPNTAKEMGLIVNDNLDERDNLDKSTLAACKVLANYYLYIQKQYKITSWVLTAAAYNFGIGNLVTSIDKQGKDYFSMKLNAETAVYVYKIIAVKELFEYPEFYMKGFGYNVFNASAITEKIKPPEVFKTDTLVFNSMEVQINKEGKTASASDVNYKYIMLSAQIKGKYKNFRDGKLISLELLDNLQTKGKFRPKGTIIQGMGWMIDDKINIDLGFGDHEVIIYDSDSNFNSKGYCQQGLNRSSLKNNHSILLKVEDYED